MDLITAAVLGLENSAFELAVKLLILFFVILWMALIYYTFADARRRITDPVVIAAATAASVIPFFGTIIYMIARPPEYLEDIRERELEIKAAEARLSSVGVEFCPYCAGQIGPDFLRCPHCLRKLKEACGGCGKPLDPQWNICPYCETAIPGITPRRRPAVAESAAGSADGRSAADRGRSRRAPRRERS